MFSWHHPVLCWHRVEFSVTSDRDDSDDGGKDDQPHHDADHHPGGLGVGLAGNFLNTFDCEPKEISRCSDISHVMSDQL